MRDLPKAPRDLQSVPRRADINKHTAAELAIRNAIIEVEKLPADTRLSDTMVRLSSAAKHLADYVDINPTLDVSQPARIGVGAIVRLNNGGPNMLVTHPLRENEWQCEYAGPGGTVRETFLERTLTLLIPHPKLISMVAPGDEIKLTRSGNPHRHGSDSDSTLDGMDNETKARLDAKIRIGSAVTAQSLLGIAITLKPGEEVMIPSDDIMAAFPQWKWPLPEHSPYDQFRGELRKLTASYDLEFHRADGLAGPAIGDGQWRLTRLVATGADMEELLRLYRDRGPDERLLAQVIRAVLWHATEGKFPDLNTGVIINARD